MLKAYALVTSALDDGYWLQLALIEVELTLGLAFLFGLFLSVLRWVGLVLFVLFLVVSVSKAFQGEHSCACFGIIDLSPWAAALIDVVAITMLWKWRAPRPSTEPPSIAYGVVLLPIVSLLFFVEGSPPSDLTPLLSCSQLVDLGQMSQGEGKAFSLKVRNLLGERVVVETLEVSCECLSASLPQEISPAEEVAVAFFLDLEKQPSFVGRLSVRCTGRTQTGSIALSTVVKANVVRSP